MLESVKAISEFIRHMVSEHKLTFEEGHLRDLIDAGLERIRLETHCMKQSVRLTRKSILMKKEFSPPHHHQKKLLLVCSV